MADRACFNLGADVVALNACPGLDVLLREERMIRSSAASLLLLVGLCGALPSLAQAPAQSCDQHTLDAVGRFLHVDNFQEAGYQDETDVIVAASCKTWPKDANITLVAAAYMLPDDPGRNEDQGNRRFVVAMVDTSRWAVLSSFKGTIVQDATLQIRGHDDFHLDTARYDLAPGVRAFGVVFAGGLAPRAAEAWEDNYLVLFVPDGRKLRQVLVVPLEQIEGNDAYQWTVGVEKTRSHGFADLSIGVRNEAAGSKGQGRARTIIHYNGRWYGDHDGAFQSAHGLIFQP